MVWTDIGGRHAIVDFVGLARVEARDDVGETASKLVLDPVSDSGRRTLLALPQRLLNRRDVLDLRELKKRASSCTRTEPD